MTSRNWCFTLNNYTDEDINKINAWEVTYIVYGKEVGEEGTPHLQGYVEWKSAKKLSTLKNLEQRIHWEIRRGPREEAIRYCKKDGWVYEDGRAEIKPGKRNDLDIIKNLVKSGASMKEIWDASPSYQACKMAEIGIKLHETKRTWKTLVRWYWGPTGTGKTKRAFEEAKDPWVSGRNLKWWEGYDRHEDVIIDDFRADFCTFHELLRILDRYEYRIETKGGSRQLVAKNIWITSCHPPKRIYQKSEEDVKQLLRRIDTVLELTQRLEPDSEVGGNTITPTLEEDNIDTDELTLNL